MSGVAGLTHVAETLLEVPYANDDHENVHSGKVGDDWKSIHHQLLGKSKVFHVDRVQTRLGAAADGEEKRIYRRQVSKAA